MTDSNGIPLVVRTGPANQADAIQALEMLNAIPPCVGPRGPSRRRPKVFLGDGAYGIRAIIAEVARCRVHSLLAVRKGTCDALKRIGQDPLRRGAVAQLDEQFPPTQALLQALQ